VSRWRTLPARIGIGACAACCAIPLLVSAGLIGGGVAAGLGVWLPRVAVVLVAVGIVVLLVPARRRRGSCGCASRAASCGCGSGAPRAQLRAAPTLREHS
jgi:mercuric ion transport protein